MSPIGRAFATNCLLFIVAAVCLADEADDYLQDGHLKHAVSFSHQQLGGFAGRLETSISIDKDGSWKAGSGVGGRLKETSGKLNADQMRQLSEAFAEHDLTDLPKTIGSDKPVKSPRQIADGASTTIKLKFGEHVTTANTADGVALEGDERAHLARLRQIEKALRQVTINVASQ